MKRILNRINDLPLQQQQQQQQQQPRQQRGGYM